MSNSLSDQLLKAGLITQDQVEKADQDKQKQKEKARAKFKKKTEGHNQSARNKNKPETRKPPAKKPQKQPSDLAKFYNQRNQLEQSERAEEEKRKREAAERRRKTRKQVRELINANLKNEESADIRYNFVVGDNVKYLFVTEAQQTLIAEGKLSITFIDGKRCLVPVEIGEQILALDPEKVVIRYTEDDAAIAADSSIDIPENIENAAAAETAQPQDQDIAEPKSEKTDGAETGAAEQVASAEASPDSSGSS